MREVEGTFAFRVFHSEWPSTLDAEGNSIPNGKAVEELTWEESNLFAQCFPHTGSVPIKPISRLNSSPEIVT